VAVGYNVPDKITYNRHPKLECITEESILINDNKEFTAKQRILGQAQLTHFDPSNAVHQMHLSRYVFAAQYLKAPYKVLDIACGIGYGSHYLAKSVLGIRVVGIDISEQAIHYGLSHFKTDTTDFQVGDGTQLHFPDDTFDQIVSFETVEHIPEYNKFLFELRRVLKPNGRLIISTPNREFTNPLGSLDSRPPSSHHIREWRISEFMPLLDSLFDNILWYSQITIKHPLIEKAFIVSRRPLARMLPVLQRGWIYWHREKDRSAGRSEAGLIALRERFKITPWVNECPGRVIVAICEKTEAV
jgi:ubiquinone/menaquinone biosynthesis C-methylase UbiE